MRSSRLASWCSSHSNFSAHTWKMLMDAHTHTHTQAYTNMCCLAVIVISIHLVQIKTPHTSQKSKQQTFTNQNTLSNTCMHCLIEMSTNIILAQTKTHTATMCACTCGMIAPTIMPMCAYTCRHNRAYLCMYARAWASLSCVHAGVHLMVLRCTCTRLACLTMYTYSHARARLHLYVHICAEKIAPMCTHTRG